MVSLNSGGSVPPTETGGSVTICGACFDALGTDKISFTIEATVQNTYDTCPDCATTPNPSLITNTAYLALVEATFPGQSDCSLSLWNDMYSRPKW